MGVRTALAVRGGGQERMLGFLTAAAVLVGVYLAFPAHRPLWWSLLGALSVAAVTVGIAVHRPAHRAGWVLLGGVLLAEAVGDLAYHFAGGVVGSRQPFPTAADVFYLLEYPLAITGMLMFTRRDPREHRTGTLIDVLIIATGMATVTWAVFVIPYSHLPHTLWWHKAILLTYLVGDAAMLTLAVRLPLTGRLHSTPVRLLLLGAVGLLFSDAYYSLAQLHQSWHPGLPADFGWAVFFISWGAAALCPSMVQVAEAPAGKSWAIASPRTWTVALCLAALVGPVLLIVDSGRVEQNQLVALYCILLFGLVLIRLVRAMAAWQESVRRREAEAYFRALVTDASDAIMIADPSGTVRYASPAAENLFGDKLDAGQLTAMFTGQDRPRVARALHAATLPDATPQWPETFRVEASEGRLIHAEARWSDLRSKPTVGGIVLTLRDVTEQRRLHEELRSEARSDPLTGLANRRGLRELLQSSFRDGLSERPGGLLMIDLDDFKEVNDTLGHPVGDELLAAVATRIGESVRTGDVVARLGGDEFAVLLGPAPTAEALETVAHRLVGAFDSPFDTSAGPLRAACSVGLTVVEHGEGDPDALLRNADLALNEAKDEGKHRWRRYDARLLDGAVQRANLRAALDEALHDETLSLRYQPVVHLDTGRISGFEALVRWPHPQRGLLGPNEFISLAEQTGQIVPLGEQVMHAAVAQAAVWNTATPGKQCRIGVNASVHQLKEAEFTDSVHNALTQARLDPELLVLEVTETALIEQSDTGVRQCLNDLRSLGVHIALDDFGTGYASLISLHNLPIDILKIDKSFLTYLNTSPRMDALLSGITAIADRLELRTIAEGVTTAEQRDTLIAMHCRLGQGRFYSDPMPAQHATTLWTGTQHYAPSP